MQEGVQPLICPVGSWVPVLLMSLWRERGSGLVLYMAWGPAHGEAQRDSECWSPEAMPCHLAPQQHHQSCPATFAFSLINLGKGISILETLSHSLGLRKG